MKFKYKTRLNASFKQIGDIVQINTIRNIAYVVAHCVKHVFNPRFCRELLNAQNRNGCGNILLLQIEQIIFTDLGEKTSE